jgi:cyanate permease
MSQIRRFGIGQTAKVAGVLYALMGLLVAPFFLIAGKLSPESTPRFGTGFALALPILYGACGYVFVAIGCAIYNFVAGFVGGIEVELD